MTQRSIAAELVGTCGRGSGRAGPARPEGAAPAGPGPYWGPTAWLQGLIPPRRGAAKGVAEAHTARTRLTGGTLWPQDTAGLRSARGGPAGTVLHILPSRSPGPRGDTAAGVSGNLRGQRSGPFAHAVLRGLPLQFLPVGSSSAQGS